MNTKNDIPRIEQLLRKEYGSGAKPISLFQSLSFHRGKSGVITNYGTEDYTLQFTDRKPIKKYRLVSPVKSNRKADYGKKITQVTVYEWNYIVLSWIPEKNIKLQVKQTVKYPDGTYKVLFKSKIFNMSEKKDAIKLFKDKVVAYKKIK